MQWVSRIYGSRAKATVALLFYKLNSQTQNSNSISKYMDDLYFGISGFEVVLCFVECVHKI